MLGSDSGKIFEVRIILVGYIGYLEAVPSLSHLIISQQHFIPYDENFCHKILTYRTILR